VRTACACPPLARPPTCATRRCWQPLRSLRPPSSTVGGGRRRCVRAVQQRGPVCRRALGVDAFRAGAAAAVPTDHQCVPLLVVHACAVPLLAAHACAAPLLAAHACAAPLLAAQTCTAPLLAAHTCAAPLLAAHACAAPCSLPTHALRPCWLPMHCSVPPRSPQQPPPTHTHTHAGCRRGGCGLCLAAHPTRRAARCGGQGGARAGWARAGRRRGQQGRVRPAWAGLGRGHHARGTRGSGGAGVAQSCL